MPEKYVDPAHRVPDAQWAQVVADAEKYRLEAEAKEED